MQRRLILSVLSQTETLTVATLREDGWPQANVVSFVNDDLTIYFGTAPDSRKIENIAGDSRVSATITPERQGSEPVQAISLAGVAERVMDAGELLRVAGLVLKKFPKPGPTEPAAVLEGVAVVRLRPTIVSLLDYSRSFGQTDLIELGDSETSPDRRDDQLS